MEEGTVVFVPEREGFRKVFLRKSSECRGIAGFHRFEEVLGFEIELWMPRRIDFHFHGVKDWGFCGGFFGGFFGVVFVPGIYERKKWTEK